LLHAQLRAGLGHAALRLLRAGLGAGHGGAGGVQAALGGVLGLRAQEAFLPQLARAFELGLGVAQFHLRLAHDGDALQRQGLGLAHAGLCHLQGGLHVAGVQPGQQLAGLHARAFAHVQLDQPAAGLAGHRRAALRHHEAAGGELLVLHRRGGLHAWAQHHGHAQRHGQQAEADAPAAAALRAAGGAAVDLQEAGRGAISHGGR
jgi:hypothetical protein